MTAPSIPPGSELRGFSSAERTLDAAGLAALRPALPPSPRKRGTRTRAPDVADGRLCPICKTPFFDFTEFAEHIWEETPRYIADLDKEAQQWRDFEEWAGRLDDEPRRVLRESARALLATRPGLTTKQIAAALGYRGRQEIWLEAELARMADGGELATRTNGRRQRWHLAHPEKREGPA